jgi:pantoate--beta-alanine ligase
MITTVDALRARLDSIRSAAAGVRVAHVTTLGSLHDGHIDLVHRAKELADVVVVTVFANPLRFRNAAELEAYPRTPDDDERLLDSLGVDDVFGPDAAELLPRGADTTKVSAGDLGLRYEGSARATYFDALLTIEAMLMNIVKPDVAVYGERDRQRVFLVRRMVRDLFLDVEIDAIPTVREDDGVPISTRLALLDEADRGAARKLTEALDAAAANADRGVDACIAAAQSTLMGEPRVRLEYLSVVDPDTFLPADENRTGPALALIAGTIGGHRFVDNTPVLLG